MDTVLGGRQGKLPTAAFEVYDFVMKSWRQLPKVPSRRVFVNYVIGGDKIFSLGGLKENAHEGFTDICEIFDMKSGIVAPIILYHRCAELPF